ncbi:MAG TPA: membrane dipeptidase [Solirubrobacterales bacterium]|jgi:microsomal dipeptidase-like Zn-dependent dipeptidase|nr:membrane dipeptidase [Solirubrobacterales bacterium]
MIADMHCHYPMHLAARAPKRRPPEVSLTAEEMEEASDRPDWVDDLRAAGLRLAANFLNFEDGWRVSLDELERGDVRAVFSALYEPFAELDFDEPYGAPPEDRYFDDLITRLDGVKEDLETIDPARKRHEIVTTAADLDRVVDAGKVAFMHCVEGGFHLGGEVEEVKENVGALADRGVVYITLAHLFWRQIATNAPAIPFLGDGFYKRIFKQPSRGLSELGEAAIEAMYKRDMLIDLSHMNQQALDETFSLLDRLDRESGAVPTDHPVVATHAGYRFGEQEYMLSPDTIKAIARRGGVIGLILARHQLNDEAGVEDPDDEAETPLVLKKHIDEIRACVPGNTNAHVAIGSDLDGFIKPTVAGIEKAGDLAKLEVPLREAYGDDAAMILSGNAMAVARKALST